MLLHRQLSLSVIKFFVACALLLAGCQKEKAIEGMLQIDAEVLKSNSKAVVDGLNSSWQAGDEIRFGNGLTKTVVVDGDRFYVDSEGITSGLAAVCPASAVKDGVVTLPATYQYRTDASGHQVVDMPMAAYYDGASSLFFKHLTGGLFFNVSNNTGATVMLDRITVENAVYYMNGATLPLSSINAAFLDGDRCFTTSGDDAERKRVSLLFNDGLELASGASRQLLVPVPAFATDAAFTVTVYAHNGDVSCFHFNQTQGDGHVGHIAASQAGFANIALGNNENAQPFEGNGTYALPYLIYTKEDYKRMVDSVNGERAATYRAKYYDIAADIDMGGGTVDGLRDFAGVIDGKGHTISNVCFGNSSGTGDLGMVSKTYTDAMDTIRNLSLDYVSFSGTGTNVGAFVGNGYVNRPYLVLTNCHLGHITFPVLNTSAAVGGLVGYIHNYNNSGRTVLYQCSIEQPLTLTSEQTSSCTGNLQFGGLVGNPAISVLPFTVTNCEVNADISVYAPMARTNVGCVVGLDGSTSTYTNVTIKTGTTVTVTGKDNISIGALAGIGSGNLSTYNNISAQSITINGTTVHNGQGTSWVGGLLGQGTSNNARNYNNCAVSGSITLTKGKETATSYLGMVSGSGDTRTHWDDSDRGNSASVTLTVTNEGSSNDHLGNVCGNQENYSSSK